MAALLLLLQQQLVAVVRISVGVLPVERLVDAVEIVRWVRQLDQ